MGGDIIRRVYYSMSTPLADYPASFKIEKQMNWLCKIIPSRDNPTWVDLSFATTSSYDENQKCER